MWWSSARLVQNVGKIEFVQCEEWRCGRRVRRGRLMTPRNRKVSGDVQKRRGRFHMLVILRVTFLLTL